MLSFLESCVIYLRMTKQYTHKIGMKRAELQRKIILKSLKLKQQTENSEKRDEIMKNYEKNFDDEKFKKAINVKDILEIKD